MTTTLTIDEELVGILQQKAESLGLPFKDVVQLALREGAANLEKEASQPPVVKTRPHAFGFKKGIDLNKLNQLADELEVEEAARKIASAQ